MSRTVCEVGSLNSSSRLVSFDQVYPGVSVRQNLGVRAVGEAGSCSCSLILNIMETKIHSCRRTYLKWVVIIQTDGFPVNISCGLGREILVGVSALKSPDFCAAKPCQMMAQVCTMACTPG